MAEKLDKPGRFVSEIPGYPGHFSLPHPFLDRHMRLWWQTAFEDVRDVSRIEYEAYNAEWNAAAALIRDFGEWSIENVPPGDLDTDNVPMVVKTWVMAKASEYVYPFLMPKQKRLALGTI